MANLTEDRKDAAKRKAQNHFTASEQRDQLVRQEIEKERTVLATRTAKLRALRLAKEAEDQAEAARIALETPPKPKAKARVRKVSVSS